jgi:hypothetical protein
VRAAVVAAALASALLGVAPPPGAASPGQERGNGVATLVLEDVVLVGISLTGATDRNSGPGGRPVPVVRLAVRSLTRTSSLDLTRPLADGSLRLTAASGAGGTVRARDGVVLDVPWACVRGLGVTEAGLLSGLLDAPLNEALDVDPAVGFRPTWVTALANLIGATPVPVVIRELRAEVASIDARSLRLPGLRLVRDERRVAPLRACSTPAAARSGPAAAPLAPGAALTRLRAVPGLRRLPATVPRP